MKIAMVFGLLFVSMNSLIANADVFADKMLDVHNTAQEALAKPPDEQLQGFCTLVENDADVIGISNAVIGSYGDDLTDADRLTYQKLVKNLVVDYFQTAWGKFLSGKAVEIRPNSRKRGSENIVEVVIGRGTVIQFYMSSESDKIRLTNAVTIGFNLLVNIKTKFESLANNTEGKPAMTAIFDYLATFQNCSAPELKTLQ